MVKGGTLGTLDQQPQGSPMQDFARLKPVEMRGHVLPQLGIVRSSNGIRHFTRVIPVSAGYGITPLCGQKIKRYGAEGCLFRPFKQEFAIHHVADFCQGCKARFRNTFGIRFGRLLTFMMPERYPGCPVNERFALVCIEPKDTTDGARAKQSARLSPPILRGYLPKPNLPNANNLGLITRDVVFWDLQNGTSSLN